MKKYQYLHEDNQILQLKNYGVEWEFLGWYSEDKLVIKDEF